MRNFGIKHSGCIPYWHVNIDRYSERGTTPLRVSINTRTSGCQFSKHWSSFQANKVIFANRWASINPNTIVFDDIFQVLERRIPQLLLKSLDTSECSANTHAQKHRCAFVIVHCFNIRQQFNKQLVHSASYSPLSHLSYTYYRHVSVFIELSSVSSCGIL